MENLKTYTMPELKDELLGPVGTKGRDIYETELAAEIERLSLGSAIRSERKRQSLTQTQLGEKMGVKKSTVSQLENGRNPRYFTIIRAMKALGINTLKTKDSMIAIG